MIYDEARNTANQDFKYGIVSLTCDNLRITAEDGVYQLPTNAKHITIRASVQNYALQDVKVKFYVDGINDNSAAVSYQKLEPIQISNLTHGVYDVHLQVLDSSGTQILHEKTYRLEKQIQTWEQPWYRLYLVLVCVELIVSATWTVINMSSVSRQKRQFEKLSKELEDKVEAQVKQIKEQEEKEIQMFRRMIVALSDTVDAKDRYTSGHSRRVAEYSRMIALRMGKSMQEQEEIYYSGLLHDVGKIRVPVDVINKPGKLTDEEFEMIKIHPVTSYRILKDISENSLIAVGAKFHHERYDGRGYPNGLSGENIPRDCTNHRCCGFL